MHRKRGGAKGNNASPAGSGNTKNNGASGADINNYAGQIKSAIESKFYDASSYAGKTCTLRIKLAPDGMLLDIKPEGGDPHFVKLRWQQLNSRRSRNHQARQYMKCSKTRHWTSNRNRDVDCSDGQHQAPVATGFW